MTRQATTAADTEEGRVGLRRAKVRARILDTAQRLIHERGIAAVTIDDIADAADIARRSFYHHFASKHEVLVPIARARTKFLNRRIDRRIAQIDDPAEILATAMRYALRAFSTDPLCRWFVLHSGLPQQRLHEGVGESAMRDVARGIEVGRFSILNREVAHVMVAGAFLAALSARVEGRFTDGDLDYSVEHILRLLGVPEADSHELAHRRMEPLRLRRDDSMIAISSFKEGAG